MNRIIKFRVWKNKYYDYYNERWADNVGINNIFSSIQESGYIVQQFTGFIDINGKEVYEGDLVNIVNRGVTHGPDAEYLKNCEVHWSEENGCWEFGKFHSPGIGYWGGYTLVGDRLDIDTLEVVGNIFQNKDLIRNKMEHIEHFKDA